MKRRKDILVSILRYLLLEHKIFNILNYKNRVDLPCFTFTIFWDLQGFAVFLTSLTEYSQNLFGLLNSFLGLIIIIFSLNTITIIIILKWVSLII